MNTKFLTGAAAKRIAAKLSKVRADSLSLNYREVIAALNAENIHNAPGSVDDLMFELREAGAPALRHIADMIADACAREACNQQETLRDLRHAFSKLGVAFEHDII